MPNNFDFKLIVSLIATVLVIYGYYPYLRDIFLKKTEPHSYTWLVWAITQGTAAAAVWYGGGNYAVFSLLVGLVLVVFVFLLSFRYGTKNITRGDTYALIAALLAIVVWWGLDEPLLSVFMISVIDGIGYIPTLRKSYEKPWSETLSFWMIMAIVNILIIISVAEYNFLTVAYSATLILTNIGTWGICFFRRKTLNRLGNPQT